MVIRLYKFVKRTNSTKRPPLSTEYIVITGALMNDSSSSVTRFMLTVANHKTENNTTNYLYEYNYAYIPVFNRYYWVNSWHYSNNGTWTAELLVDPLASWRGAILNRDTTGYCTRTDKTVYINNYLVDSVYPSGDEYKIETETVTTSLFNANPAQGTFVLGILSVKPPVYGAMNYYIVPTAQMTTLISNMVSISPSNYDVDSDWKNSGLTSELLKSIVSPMSYIKSCKWLPINFDYTLDTTDSNNKIYLGAWFSGAYGLRIDNNSQSTTGEFYLRAINVFRPSDSRIIVHPPYTHYSLFNSLLGDIPLDDNILAGLFVYCVENNISYNTQIAAVSLTVNFISGTLKYAVKYRTPDADSFSLNSFDGLPELYHNSVNIAVDLPLADISYQYVEQAKSGVDAVASAFNYKDAILNPGTYAANIANNLIDTVVYTYQQKVGSVGQANGAFFSDIGDFIFTARYTLTCEQSIQLFGKPCNRVIPLVGETNDLNMSGSYVQMVGVQLATPLTDTGACAMLKSEYDAIIEFLKNGVYLE